MAIVVPFIATWDNKALMKASRDLKAKGAEIKRAGQGISSVGKALTVGLTVPLLLIGTFALKSAADIGAATKQIRVETGATGEDLRGLKQDFEEVFANVPAKASEVATAIGQLNTRTDQTGPGLQTLATQILNLSRITGEELEPTIATVTRVYGDWSIATEDQAAATDYLFKVSQSTGISVTELAQTVVQFGAPLRQLGFTFEESAAMLGKWEKEGVNTQTTLAGLRFSLKTFAREGLDAREGLKKYAQQIKDAATPAEATGLAMKVFGMRAGPDMAAAIREGRLDIQQFVEQLKNSPETINKAAEETLTFSQQMQIFKNQLALAAEPLGKVILQMRAELIPVIKSVVDAIARASDAFSKLPEGAKRSIVIGGMIAAAIGPALIVIGQLVTSVGGMVQMFGQMAAASAGSTSAAAGAFSALGPVAAVIAALAAAVGLVVASFGGVEGFMTSMGALGPLLGSQLGQIKESLKDLGQAFAPALDAIVAAIGPALSMIKEAFTGIVSEVLPTINSLVTYITAAWKFIAPVVVPILAGLAAAIAQIFGAILNVIRAVMALIRGDWSGAWNAIKAALAGILQGIWALLVGVFKGIVPLLAAIWNGLKAAAVAAWNGIKAAIAAVISGLVSWITGTWARITSGAQAAWNGLKIVVSAAIEAVKDVVATQIAIVIALLTGNWRKAGQLTASLLAPLANIVRNAWNRIRAAIAVGFAVVRAAVSAGWNAIVSYFRALPGRLASLVRSAWNAIRSAITGAWPAVKSAVRSGWDGVMSFFRSLPGKLASVGRGIVDGLKDGIRNAWDSFISWIGGQIGDMVRRVKEKLGINSPSRVFAEIGAGTMEGMAQGVAQAAAQVHGALGGVADAVAGQFAGAGVLQVAVAGAAAGAPARQAAYPTVNRTLRLAAGAIQIDASGLSAAEVEGIVYRVLKRVVSEMGAN